MLEHGVPWRLSKRVQRIVAPNAGPMTGAGTNTYLLGKERITVLDPGPAIDAHVAAILHAGKGRIEHIVCTHTHPDHSPAWKAIAEATGATVIGALPAGDDHQDTTFKPHIELQHGYCHGGSEFTLRALHTPGHVSNHFCFLLEEEHLLFAGDHVMNGSTVVIIPPGGDMQAYITSLAMLLDYRIDHIAPGHGELIDDSAAEIRGLIEHRLKREAKVLNGLRRMSSCDLDALVTIVYDDVDPALYPWAKLSMEAHLIKLEGEGSARRGGPGIWSAG